jgi:hypothetical protein
MSFWSDIEAAYRQVAANHDRMFVIESSGEHLTALVEYDNEHNVVNIRILVGVGVKVDDKYEAVSKVAS